MNLPLTLFLAFCILFGTVSYQPLFASPTPPPVDATITITGTVPGCGDGVIQPGEECDGASLNNHTCVSRGFFGGTLSCNPDCTFNLSQCTVVPPPPPAVGQPGVRFVTPRPMPIPTPPIICLPLDFNCDGKINLVDLSISLYWMGQPPELALRYDLNADGRLDIRDISIMLYHWTG